MMFDLSNPLSYSHSTAKVVASSIDLNMPNPKTHSPLNTFIRDANQFHSSVLTYPTRARSDSTLPLHMSNSPYARIPDHARPTTMPTSHLHFVCPFNPPSLGTAKLIRKHFTHSKATEFAFPLQQMSVAVI